MTAIHRQTSVVRMFPAAPPPPPPAPDSPPALDGLTLAWDVLPDAPGLQTLFHGRPSPSHARLVLILRGGVIALFLDTTTAGAVTRTPLPLSLLGPATPVAITFDDAAAACMPPLAHIDAPGVLAATIVLKQHGNPRALYARTPLLRTLGFPGGAYDRPAAGWDTGAPSKI